MTNNDETESGAGNGLLRVTWLLVVIDCILGALILGTGIALLPLIPFVAWPLSIVGLVLAMKAAYRYWRNSPPPRERKRTILVAGTVLAAGAVTAGHTMLIPMVWKAEQDCHKALATWANLAGLNVAIKQYCDEYEEFPQSLKELIDSGLIVSKQLLSYLDPNIYTDEWRKEGYLSFVYCPAADSCRDEPDVVLAWEREAWSPLELGLFPKQGRWVLFGDGTVRRLGANDFFAARQQDRIRRAELGWPVCE